MKQKLFAFWKYDKFPYLLGGTITRFCEKDYPGKGWIETEEHGAGYFFKPLKIVTQKTGKEMMVKLRQLEARKSAVIAATNTEFKAALTDLKKQLGFE